MGWSKTSGCSRCKKTSVPHYSTLFSQMPSIYHKWVGLKQVVARGGTRDCGPSIISPLALPGYQIQYPVSSHHSPCQVIRSTIQYPVSSQHSPCQVITDNIRFSVSSQFSALVLTGYQSQILRSCPFRNTNWPVSSQLSSRWVICLRSGCPFINSLSLKHLICVILFMKSHEMFRIIF